MLYRVFLFIFLVFLLSCSPEKAEETTATQIFSGLKNDTGIRYAKRFSAAENEFCRVLYLYGRKDPADTTSRYVFLKKAGLNLPKQRNTFYFSGPCRRIASLSSVYSAMLCELNAGEDIIAIENIDYYNHPFILNKFSEGRLTELSKSAQMDIEKAISLKPDVIFTFGMGEAEKSPEEKIIRAGIPLVITVDHLEATPLARAEWIKFFGEFVARRTQGDSLFAITEAEYKAYRELAKSAEERPRVFTEIKYGDIWYVPGGGSYASNFIRDAGAAYVWENDSNTGSLHLSFEEVLLKARDAEFWLNISLCRTKKEVLALESRYKEFRAFKSGQMYNHVLHTNSKGYSSYWETGIMYPQRVLSDLIQIFHPSLKEKVKNDLYYYKKLD